MTTGTVFDRTPSFTRSGRRILFTRFVSAGSDEKSFDVEHIFSIRRDGGGLRRLTSGRFSDRNPVMSPNGRIIAFERAGRVGVEPHVYTMRSNGSRVVDATPGLAGWTSQPDFSPSGTRIVFVRGYPGAPNADLFTMRPNGRGLRRLTGRPHRPVGYFSNPRFSPNGRLVVAARMPASRSFLDAPGDPGEGSLSGCDPRRPPDAALAGHAGPGLARPVAARTIGERPFAEGSAAVRGADPRRGGDAAAQGDGERRGHDDQRHFAGLLQRRAEADRGEDGGGEQHEAGDADRDPEGAGRRVARPVHVRSGEALALQQRAARRRRGPRPACALRRRPRWSSRARSKASEASSPRQAIAPIAAARDTAALTPPATPARRSSTESTTAAISGPAAAPRPKPASPAPTTIPATPGSARAIPASAAPASAQPPTTGSRGPRPAATRSPSGEATTSPTAKGSRARPASVGVRRMVCCRKSEIRKRAPNRAP